MKKSWIQDPRSKLVTGLTAALTMGALAMTSCSPLDEPDNKAKYASAAIQTATSNCSAEPISGQTYYIVNHGSGKALDVEKKSTANGANIIQWKANAGTNQRFQVTDLGNDYWSIIAIHSGKSLDVFEMSSSNGGSIKQRDYHGDENQLWRLRHSSTGAFNIVSKHSSKSLSVDSSNNGADVYQSTYLPNAFQQWFFNPTDGDCNSSDGSGGGDGSDPDNSQDLIGFANEYGNDGLSTTTGGGNASPVTVDSCSALSLALGSSSPAVIQIPDNTTIDCRTPDRTIKACKIECPSYQGSPDVPIYRVPVGDQSCTDLGSDTNSTVNRTQNETRITIRSDKTLEGLGKNSKIRGASFSVSGVKNVIIRNLTIEEVNPGLVEAGDGISMNNSSHVWVDHVRFRLISDGHIDMYDSRNVTLSWNQFNGANPYYCGGQHAYTQIISNSHVTEHHNDYLDVYGRNPKVIGQDSRVHIFNNSWKNVPYFSISAGNYAQVKAEGNYFENAAKPHWDTGNGYIDANNNVYKGSSASDDYKDSNASLFTDLNLYPYHVESTDGLQDVIDQGAGPR